MKSVLLVDSGVKFTVVGPILVGDSLGLVVVLKVLCEGSVTPSEEVTVLPEASVVPGVGE